MKIRIRNGVREIEIEDELRHFSQNSKVADIIKECIGYVTLLDHREINKRLKENGK